MSHPGEKPPEEPPKTVENTESLPSSEPMQLHMVLVISEQHRYPGVSYKSDIIVISGLDVGDRQVLEQRFAGFDPPCLLDSSDGR